jgi:phosphatidylglycerophosphatase A
MKNALSRLWPWLCLAAATTLFTGFLPGAILRRRGKGGGTAGTAVAALALVIFRDAPFWAIAAATTVSFLVGLAVVGPAERLAVALWGPRRRHTGETVTTDLNETNVDEVHGLLLAAWPAWLLPANGCPRLIALAAALVLFRLLDGFKPWPIGRIEARFKGSAFGVMIDDTVAGTLAALILALAIAIAMTLC